MLYITVVNFYQISLNIFILYQCFHVISPFIFWPISGNIKQNDTQKRKKLPCVPAPPKTKYRTKISGLPWICLSWYTFLIP